MRRTDLFEKTLILGKIEGRREGDDRGWNGWMASPTQWIWVWVNSGSWWWTARPGMLQSMGLQRVRHDWLTALTELMMCREQSLAWVRAICVSYYYNYLPGSTYTLYNVTLTVTFWDRYSQPQFDNRIPRIREVKYFPQGYRAIKWRFWIAHTALPWLPRLDDEPSCTWGRAENERTWTDV